MERTKTSAFSGGERSTILEIYVVLLVDFLDFLEGGFRPGGVGFSFTEESLIYGVFVIRVVVGNDFVVSSIIVGVTFCDKIDFNLSPFLQDLFLKITNE
jgi:hypothetical protein